MDETDDRPARFTAFVGHRRLAQGDLATVATAAAEPLKAGASVLILDDRNGERLELDPRESLAALLTRHGAPSPAPPTRGRPRLGVTAKEVTLLPRHWDWLSAQPGGASAALRRLVDAARREGAAVDDARRSHRAVDRFLYLVAGDLPQFEEVYRAFYASDAQGFTGLIADWPADVRDHAQTLFDIAMADQARAAKANAPA